ncbi:uncharacterized protein [Bactrocera oleae]|uniref:uncharacterized protein n=1 Tax=Bactrocera oleae TaxID=104688 RepID=UPI00387E5FB0
MCVNRSWIAANFQFKRNRRGGLNLLYHGYMYTAERRYNSTINWVCSRNSSLTLRCPARCITAGQSNIKLSQRCHNHSPIS